MQDNTRDFGAILQDIHNLKKNRTLQDKLYDNHTFCTHTHDIHELPLSVPTNEKILD